MTDHRDPFAAGEIVIGGKTFRPRHTSAGDQLHIVRSADIPTLRDVLALPADSVTGSARKAAASRLRRLERETPTR